MSTFTSYEYVRFGSTFAEKCRQSRFGHSTSSRPT